MFSKKLFSKIAILGFVFSLGATMTFAQEDPPSQDPSTKYAKGEKRN